MSKSPKSQDDNLKDENINALKLRIRELEQEVTDRERDLSLYRKELSEANSKLEKLLVRLDHEINLAHEIQRVLIPTELPHISGFEFSSKFIPGQKSGGDYFDIFEHVDRFRFSILIASSNGYGLSALLLSLLLKLSGQLGAKKGMPPDELIHHVSHDLGSQMSGQDHIHLFYGVIDRRNFEMTYSSVGQVLGIHQSHVTNQLTLLEGDSEPLGPQTLYQKSSMRLMLNPRDRLVFCTPGLVNLSNSEGEFFGKDKIIKAVMDMGHPGVHEIRNEIIFQMEKFSGSREIDRDVTVVVTEVKDRVIKLATTDETASKLY